MDLNEEDVYIGNGPVSWFLSVCRALVDDGDEILIPAPDYPVLDCLRYLAGGKAVHYICDEEFNWYLTSRISGKDYAQH